MSINVISLSSTNGCEQKKLKDQRHGTPRGKTYDYLHAVVYNDKLPQTRQIITSCLFYKIKL